MVADIWFDGSVETEGPKTVRYISFKSNYVYFPADIKCFKERRLMPDDFVSVPDTIYIPPENGFLRVTPEFGHGEL